MVNSAIKEIFRHKEIKPSEAYSGLLSKSCDMRRELEQGLSDGQKELFRQLEMLEATLGIEDSEVNFSEGFKMGLRIGLELN